MDLSLFEHEYDRNKFLQIQPNGKKFKMWTNAHCATLYKLSSFEEYSVRIVEAMSAGLACFIDVGAHHGYYSLLVGSLAPNCKILAFEAVLENYLTMKQNLDENNLGNTEIYPYAISNVQEIKDFYISNASDNCGFIAHPATPTKKIVQVQAYPLEDFCQETPEGPTLIKIDTEGHEIEVLDGMRGIIYTIPDLKLLVEFNPKLLKLAGHMPDEMLSKLDELGFDLYMLSESEGLFFHLSNDTHWEDYLAENMAVNILCLKKQASLDMLFFSHSAKLNGAERSLLEEITYFIARGNMCTVILPEPGPMMDLLKNMGVAVLIREFYWWCSFEYLSSDEQMRRMDISFHWLLEDQALFKKINPDLVFTNTTVHPWGALTAKITGKPHIWSVTEFGELSGLRYFIPFADVLQFIQDNANFILTNSKAIQKTLFPDLGPDRIETVYRSIKVPVEKLQKNTDTLSSDSVQIILVGSITPLKGQMDAILAVQELVKRNRKNVELLIIGLTGSTQYYNELLEMINRNGLGKYIHIMDFQEDIFPLLQQADILLNCSRMEAFGRTTLEAMLCGKPVIGANRGGTTELVQDGLTGLLYEPGDYRSLAEKIAYLSDHPEKRSELGQNAMDYAHKTFTVKTTYERVFQIAFMIKTREQKYLNVMTSLILNLSKHIVDTSQQEREIYLSQFHNLADKLSRNENELAAVYQSNAWRYVLLYRKFKNYLSRAAHFGSFFK